jgi:hypothetical protein
VTIDHLSLTIASESDRWFKDRILCIDNNLDVNNVTIKIC